MSATKLAQPDTLAIRDAMMSALQRDAPDYYKMAASDGQDEYTRVARTVKMMFSGNKCIPANQMKALSCLAEAYVGGECDNGIIDLHLLPNSSGENPNEFPTGHAVAYGKTTPVEHISVTSRIAEVIHVAKISGRETEPGKREKLSDAFFEAKRGNVNEQIPQYAENPASLNNLDKVTLNDTDSWDAEIGGHGHFVGVFKTARGRRDFDYYLIAYTGVDVATKELYHKVQNKKAGCFTFEELVESAEYRYVRRLADRNARRLIFNTAEVLGVDVRFGSDMDAYTSDDYESKPKMAAPEYRQELNVFDETQWFAKHAVSYYSMASPSRNVKDQHFILVDPHTGVVAIKGNPATALSGNKAGGFSTKAINALPASTGRKTAVKKLPQSDADKAASAERLAEVKKFVVWEGGDEANDRVALDAYRPFDDDFKCKLKDMGWRHEWGTVDYLPVLVKVSTRKMRERKKADDGEEESQ
jgi:hypothetical protein